MKLLLVKESSTKATSDRTANSICNASFYQIVKWSLFSNTHQPSIYPRSNTKIYVVLASDMLSQSRRKSGAFSNEKNQSLLKLSESSIYFVMFSQRNTFDHVKILFFFSELLFHGSFSLIYGLCFKVAKLVSLFVLKLAVCFFLPYHILFQPF